VTADKKFQSKDDKRMEIGFLFAMPSQLTLLRSPIFWLWQTPFLLLFSFIIGFLAVGFFSSSSSLHLSLGFSGPFGFLAWPLFQFLPDSNG
jgi:hypothetical protein